MEISRQEYFSGLHFFLPALFLTQGLNLCLLHWQVDSLPLSHKGTQSYKTGVLIKKGTETLVEGKGQVTMKAEDGGPVS